MPSIESFKIDGLAAATFTPYKADGSVDYAGVDAHCADLAAHGVRFAFSESISCAWYRQARGPRLPTSPHWQLSQPLPDVLFYSLTHVEPMRVRFDFRILSRAALAL